MPFWYICDQKHIVLEMLKHGNIQVQYHIKQCKNETAD